MRTATGFTLLEILIVIAIIMLLMGIGVYALPKVLATGDEKGTEALLSQLEALSAELRVLQGSYPDQAVILDPGTSNPITVNLDTLPMLLEVARGSENTRQFVGKIPADYLMRVNATDPNDGRVYAIDGYDGIILYVHPKFHNSTLRDTNDDGDTADPDDIRYNVLPKRNVPYFASAGKDRLWGDVRELQKQLTGASHDAALAAAAADNVYSFELR